MNGLEIIQSQAGDRAGMLRVLENARQIVLGKLGSGPTAYGLSILQHSLKGLQDSIEQLKNVNDSEVTDLAWKELRTLHVAMHFMPTLFPDLNAERLQAAREVLVLRETGAIDHWEAKRMICKLLPGPERFHSKEERAMIVVQAEGNRIAAISSFLRTRENAESITRAGYKLKKQWHCGSDMEKRSSHRAASGQIRELHEYFKVGRSKLLFPGDPAANDRDIIGCCCASISHIEKVK